MLPKASFAGLLLLLSVCTNDVFATTPMEGSVTREPLSKIMVEPMTDVDVQAGTGYFQDPYPIRIVANSYEMASRSVQPGAVSMFSGTNKELLSCMARSFRCVVATHISLNPGVIAQQASAAGSSIKSYENLNIYHSNSGCWDMAVTARLSKPGMPDWTVILNAHADHSSRDVPTEWVADSLLVGDLGVSATDDYDGKYFDDSGLLYLVYNAKIGKGQDAVVAQAMMSPSKIAKSGRVTLLGPEVADGGYNSELADGLNQSSTVKLIETGNIIKIGDKYVMTYSDGTYNRPDYKAGIAWSDSFLPPAGTYYKRVQKIDTKGVWGKVNHAEVQYLLQSQKERWPNYVASQVLAPGVPAIVKDGNGDYCLTFAGYDPSDAPTTDKGLYQGSHRRPYYVKLNVQIPHGVTVAKTSARDLASWIQPTINP